MCFSLPDYRILRLTLRSLLLAVLVFPAGAATVYEEDFVEGPLTAPWTGSTLQQGRVRVMEGYSPVEGGWVLVLDDAVSDAVYSTAEATLSVDLSHQKNAILSFSARSLGNEAHAPPTVNFSGVREYDGVALSLNGGATWRTVQSLAQAGAAWQEFTVELDPAAAQLGGSYGSDVRIRFSAHDNAEVPLDGLAITGVKITADPDQRSVLEIQSPLTEGSGPHTGHVLLAFAPEEPLTLTLSANPDGHLVLPATVTVEAGETSAEFTFNVADDSLFNPDRQVSVFARAEGVSASGFLLGLIDNDVPAVTLTLPVSVKEGETPTNNAVLALDRAAVAPLTLNLSAVPAGQLVFPASVTLPAGQTQVTFNLQAVNDTKIDGDIAVTLTAAATGIASALATVTAADNETRDLVLTLPAAVKEGASVSGTVALSGTLAVPFTVSLAADPPAAFTVPATVVIPAGQFSAAFSVTATDNLLRDGTRSAAVAASAPEYAATSKSLTISDNDPAAFRFSALDDVILAGNPLTLQLTALDMENNPLTGYTGKADLHLVRPDNTLAPLTPANITFPGTGVWSGTVNLPAEATSPLKIRATVDGQYYSESPAFELLRTVSVAAADLLHDPARKVIYAAVPSTATGAYANRVIALNPADLSITGSVAVGQNPRQLALTDGGEFLYVSLDANGTIAKINPATMTVVSTFPVGNDPSYGALYAEDIQTIAGKPHQLLLSQYRKSVSPSHNGVALYDQGVRLGQKTQDHTGSNRIEPSADPTLFFGYNTESTEFGFRQLKVDATGVRELAVDRNLFDGFYMDMKSAGNMVYSGGGIVVEGSLLQRKGSFGTTGLVCPDPSSQRVFFLEQSSHWFNNGVDFLAAYDPNSFSLIRRLKMPEGIAGVTSFIRWGSNGLAFSNAEKIFLISPAELVPSAPPADLRVSIQTVPALATAGQPLTYEVTVTNQGPNPAVSSILNATLSAGQSIQSVSSPVPAAVNGLQVSLPTGTLASGQSTTLVIVGIPASAGTLSIDASAASAAVDPDYLNNLASRLISVGFVPSINTVNQLRINANNVKYDPTRKLLWLTVPGAVPGPSGKALYSLNPTNGLISNPIPLNADPQRNSMAISGNGRYLYLGLTEIAEVHRVDLQSPTFASIRIPLGSNGWGSAGYAHDIHVLDGPGTSILVTTSGDNSAVVFDGTVRRTERTGIYTVNRVEPTPTPNVFIGFNNGISSYPTSRLSLSGTGVATTEVINNLINGPDIRSGGNFLLSSSGQMLDVNTLGLKWNLGANGAPAMDPSGQFAYLAGNNALKAWDTATGNLKASIPIPDTTPTHWEYSMERWGADGFVILGPNVVSLIRWPDGCPPNPDANDNMVEDTWEAANFAAAALDPVHDSDGDGIMDAMEYVFGTSPHLPGKNPMEARVTTQPNGNREIHLAFPRRAGLAQGSYSYLHSIDMAEWTPVYPRQETILSTTAINGTTVDWVEAVIPCPDQAQGFVRLRWNGP